MSKKINTTHVFDNPRNVDRLLLGFYFICIVLVILDFIVHRHISMAWEEIPAFYAIYGFAACVALVILAKWMRRVVMRNEDYYDE